MMVDKARENQRENRLRPIRAPTLNPGKSQERPKTSTGSKPIAENGLPVRVLPKKAPVPDQPNVRPRPDGTLQTPFSCREKQGRRCGPPPSTRFQAAALLPGARTRGVAVPWLSSGNGGPG